MKAFIKKFIPESGLLFYHRFLAILAALFYRFPSRKLIVIGVTGTNGKTTVCHLVKDILEQGGFKVGMTTSISFQDGNRVWENNTKQGMPGRFCLRKLLHKMVKNKCDYAIIETTSEGIKQFRHYKIDYGVAVLTNLTPDHIEAHGSFEKYRKAKEKLFKIVSRNPKGISIINLDDPNARFLLRYQANRIYGYSLNGDDKRAPEVNKYLRAEDLKLKSEGSSFKINDVVYNLGASGKYNIYNALAAICVGLSQNISHKKIKEVLGSFSGLPGRLEEIKSDKGIRIFVDYAHTEDALQNVYRALKNIPHQRMIAVLGATGGGRDKKKRPILGHLAARYADLVFVTNEDPYQEDPKKIIDQVFTGVIEGGKIEGKDAWRILERGKAIKKAIQKAKAGDIIIITGKGCERVMATKSGFVPWDDREEVRKCLEISN